MSNWEAEVIGDEATPFPDNEGLLEATRQLVKDGFIVRLHQRRPRGLPRFAAPARPWVMPLGAPIGSGPASRT